MKRKLDFIIGVPLIWLLSWFNKRTAAFAPPRRVLIIKLAAAGDTILLGSLLKSLKDSRPDIMIHWLVSPINVGIARLLPGIDRILVWSGRLSGLPSLLGILRAEKYDAVVDFEQWSRGSALLSFFSGAAVRFGYDTPGQHRAGLFSAALKKRFDRHEIEEFHALLSLIVPLPGIPEINLPVTDAARAKLAQHAPSLTKPAKSGLRVLLHPGCGSDGLPREWPIADYAVLAHWLIKTNRAEIFLSAGPEEKFKTNNLNKLLAGAAVDLGGKLDWETTVALVDAVDLVVSGNTGIMHIAAARKKKQVALHGPTNPVLWGPLNPNARVVASDCPHCPCLKLGFEYHAFDQSCMKRINIDQVKGAVSALIGNNLIEAPR